MKNKIIISMIAVALLAACNHKENEKTEETTFVVTSPLLTDTSVFREYVCQIHSIQHIELRALEKGYLQDIYVDEGQRVKKGQLMFQIMPVIYAAETQKSQAEVSFAEIEYRNSKALADSNIVSKNELALAGARLRKARAELALAKAHLNFTEIRAPFDGIVGKFMDNRKGSLLDEGELLTTLSDNDKLWVYFNVPEAEYLNYKKSQQSGNQMKVKLQMANNEIFESEGVVETIEADFNNETGNIAFRATFLNPKGLLRHGETGNILMPVTLHNALMIPQKATFEILDKKYVYVVNKEGILQAREIKIGTEMPHYYAIADGIKPGEHILVEGLRKVRNGEKINYRFEDMRQIQNDIQHLRAE